MKLQAAVPDYAQWRHVLADALDLPLSGAWRARCGVGQRPLAYCSHTPVVYAQNGMVSAPLTAELPAALPTTEQHRRHLMEQVAAFALPRPWLGTWWLCWIWGGVLGLCPLCASYAAVLDLAAHSQPPHSCHPGHAAPCRRACSRWSCCQICRRASRQSPPRSRRRCTWGERAPLAAIGLRPGLAGHPAVCKMVRHPYICAEAVRLAARGSPGCEQPCMPPHAGSLMPSSWLPTNVPSRLRRA